MRTRSKQVKLRTTVTESSEEDLAPYDPEVFSPEATEEDLAPYTRDRRTVDGDDAR